MDAEVGVVGVGTMGSMACWQLARRGVSVIGFEQYAPGHDRAGAGGESRLFRTAYLEGAQYVPLLQTAQEQWRVLERDVGRELLTLNGGLMIGDPASAFLTTVRECITRFDLPHEVLSTKEATRRYPQHRLRAGEEMILDKQAGFVRPELSVAMAAAACEERGGVIERRAAVRRIEPRTDEGVYITTDRGRWHVGTVVLACGAWSRALLPDLSSLAVQRLVMTWFPLRDPGAYTSERFPIFIRQTGDFDISGWPTLDSASLKVAVNYGYDQVQDPDDLNRTVSDDLLEVIRSAVADLLPGVTPEPVRVGAYMDGYSADHHALVGQLDGVPNTIVAYGFSGHGFKMAPAIGLAVAELATNGQTSVPIEHVNPNRFANGEPTPPLRRNIARDLSVSE